MLTITGVKAARIRSAPYKLSDGRGLHLYISPTGLRSWRLRFRFAGKESLLTLGSWPDVSLDEARDRAAGARERLGHGEDPRGASNLHDVQNRTFEQHARAWHAHMTPRWTLVHAADVIASLERDVFPAIGAMPMQAITAPVVLNALRSVEQRGRLETARRVRQRISAVFAFAIAEGAVDQDPAAVLGRALTPPAPARHHPALLELEHVQQLLADVDHVAGAGNMIALASRFLALTAVRLAAVRGAEWCEIEDLDGPAPMWRVPAARMKMAAAKKRDAGNDHLVPLSTAAVAVLRAIADMHSGDADLHGPIFPGLAERAIGALYDRAGYAGRHVPHGWRASFATIMNDRQPADRAVIDRALAHAGGMGKVEAAYNRAAQLADRRRVLQAWADALTG